MSDTTRTDATVVAMDFVRGAPVQYVPADFARQLERELKLAEQRCIHLDKDLQTIARHRDEYRDRAYAAEARLELMNAAPRAGEPIRKGNTEPSPAVAARHYGVSPTEYVLNADLAGFQPGDVGSPQGPEERRPISSSISGAGPAEPTPLTCVDEACGLPHALVLNEEQSADFMYHMTHPRQPTPQMMEWAKRMTELYYRPGNLEYDSWGK